MPKICYVPKTFRPETVSLIDRANQVCQQYAAQGYSLTLRQLYYQFVSRGWIANKDTEYKRLGSVVNDARLAGLIDWNHLEDRTRNVRELSHWDSPAQIMRAVGQQYTIDKWEKQSVRPVVMIEKDALIGVIERVCDRNDVPYFSCRGYTSQSEMWAMARRLERYEEAGQTPLILHLGDHDPSGIDMTRDIRERIELFMGGTEVKRLALNMDQVDQYQPPPNPAKMTDARYVGYMDVYGDESWELDALDPRVISDVIQDAIEEVRDPDLWDEAEDAVAEERRRLSAIADRWSEVTAFIEQDPT